jgi:hypothetical protein
MVNVAANTKDTRADVQGVAVAIKTMKDRHLTADENGDSTLFTALVVDDTNL